MTNLIDPILNVMVPPEIPTIISHIPADTYHATDEVQRMYISHMMSSTTTVVRTLPLAKQHEVSNYVVQRNTPKLVKIMLHFILYRIVSKFLSAFESKPT